VVVGKSGRVRQEVVQGVLGSERGGWVCGWQDLDKRLVEPDNASIDERRVVVAVTILVTDATLNASSP
jgi:hypothetical protein